MDHFWIQHWIERLKNQFFSLKGGAYSTEVFNCGTSHMYYSINDEGIGVVPLSLPASSPIWTKENMIKLTFLILSKSVTGTVICKSNRNTMLSGSLIVATASCIAKVLWNLPVFRIRVYFRERGLSFNIFSMFPSVLSKSMMMRWKFSSLVLRYNLHICSTMYTTHIAWFFTGTTKWIVALLFHVTPSGNQTWPCTSWKTYCAIRKDFLSALSYNFSSRK